MRSVVGIAGPGEPLANEETFETLSLIRREHPGITLCTCTNGLALPDRCADLRRIGVEYLTVTINGFDPAVVSKIQPWIRADGLTSEGLKAAKKLIDNQTLGLERAVAAGMFVKVNCVVIPDLNGAHVLDTASKVKALGAQIFNPMPLIPRGRFSNMKRPDERYMRRLRHLCGSILPVFHQCKQCRADAEGIPGKERAI